MIVCPACQHRNPEGAEVCEACGASLEGFAYRVCPKCGALNPAENLFCHRCLERLAGATSAKGEQPPATEEAEKVLAEVEEEEGTLPPFLVEQVEEAEGAPPVAEEPAPSEEEFPEALPPFIEVEEEEEEPVSEVEGPGGGETLEAVQTEAPAVPSEEREEKEEELPQVVVNPLAGVEDVLPLEAGISLPHRAEPLPTEGPTEKERADADLLRRIAEEGPPLQEAPRKAEEKGVRRLSGSGRALIYLLVLLAAVIPFFTGGQTARWVSPRRSVGVFADVMSRLPVHTPVLVSFDYSPAYGEELDPLARAVVQQLAARSVPMVVMSTKPEGIGIAEKVCTAVAQEMDNYRYGEHYAVLGYLPGEEAGLRTLRKGLADAFREDYVRHRPLSEIPVVSGIASVTDLEHIIVLSDESGIVRRWIEQVRRENTVLLHALVSARIEPTLIPYAQAGQLETLIGGAYGGAEYERATGMRGAAAQTVDADAVLFLVMLLIAVVTNVVLISGDKGRSPRR